MSRVTYSASPPAQSKKYITRSKSFVRKKTKKSYFDYSLMFLIIFMLAFGLLMLYSTSSYNAAIEFGDSTYYLKKQFKSTLLGLAVMFIVANIDYHKLTWAGIVGYVTSLILIALVLSPLGNEVNGARRWIIIGGMSIQPAEVAKLALIMLLALVINNRRQNIRKLGVTARIFALCIPPAAEILLITKNMSSALIIVGITFVMLFVASPKYSHYIILGAAGVSLIFAYLFLGSGFRSERVDAWMDPVLAFGLVGGEALDEQLQFLDLFLVFPVLVLHHPLDHLAGFVPELIVAHIHLDMAVVHVHDVGADGVQEVTVMAHHKDQALAVHQEILQPLDGLNVQMVGGLVQQDDVRLAEQRLGQQHLHLFLGGQAGHFAVQNIVGEAKALNEPGHVGFGLPAAHFGKFGLQLAGLHTVLVGEVLFFIEGILLLHHVIEALVAHHHRVQHGVGVILEMVLLQNGHPLFLGDDDLARGGLQIPGEDAEEGGLASAVGADDAVAVAGNELQLHVLEQGLATEVHAYIVDCDHVGILSSRSLRFSRRLLLLSVIAGQRSKRQPVPRRIKKRRPNGRHRTLRCPKLVLLCCFFSLLSSILLHLYRNILTFLETVNKVVNSPRR